MTKDPRIIDAIRETPLLAGLDDSTADRLAFASNIRHLERRETLFLEGDSADAFFLVLSGQIKVYKVSPDGKEHVLHLANPGQTFAEGAVFGFKGFPASAEAVEDAEVIAIPKQDFLDLLLREPRLCMGMFRALALWLHRLTDIISSLAFKDVETRLASYIVSQCRNEHGDVRDGMQFDLGIEKALLAAHLGTIPETFSRALRKLQNNGLIRVTGPHVTILDAAGLQGMIEL